MALYFRSVSACTILVIDFICLSTIAYARLTGGIVFSLSFTGYVQLLDELYVWAVVSIGGFMAGYQLCKLSTIPRACLSMVNAVVLPVIVVAYCIPAFILDRYNVAKVVRCIYPFPCTIAIYMSAAFCWGGNGLIEAKCICAGRG